MNTAQAVAVSVPASLVVMASVAGASAQVTQADRTAVKNAMLYFGIAMVGASLLSRNVAVAVATTASVGLAYYGLNKAWSPNG